MHPLAEEVAAGKVAAAVTGGESRSESVRAALAEVPEEATVVLVHDAARPLVTEEVIERVYGARRRLGRGRSGLPIADTVKRVDGEAVVETLDRDGLVTVQTPRHSWLPSSEPRSPTCAVGAGLRGPRRGARRPGAHRRGRSAAAQGDRAGRPRARRHLAMIVDYHMRLRRRRSSTTRSTRSSASWSDARRARARRDRLHRARLLLRADRRCGRCRITSSAAGTTSAVCRGRPRGEAPRLPGQARPRGRLRAGREKRRERWLRTLGLR